MMATALSKAHILTAKSHDVHWLELCSGMQELLLDATQVTRRQRRRPLSCALRWSLRTGLTVAITLAVQQHAPAAQAHYERLLGSQQRPAEEHKA